MTDPKPLFLTDDSARIMKTVAQSDILQVAEECFKAMRWLAQDGFRISGDFDPMEQMSWVGSIVFRKYGDEIENTFLIRLQQEIENDDLQTAYYILVLGADHDFLLERSRSLKMAQQFFGVKGNGKAALFATFAKLRERLPPAPCVKKQTPNADS